MDKKELKNKEADLPRQDGANWAPALEIFSEVSTWIAGPIIFALILGKYLDGRFDTRPWFFIGFTFLAFLISAFGIVRVVGKYMKKLEIEKENDIKEEIK